MKNIPPLPPKYTRGPWFQEDEENGWRGPILGLDRQTIQVIICYVQELADQDPEEVKANVELILAAPAMDNILRRILAQYRLLATAPTSSNRAYQAVMDLESILQELESFFQYPPDHLLTQPL